jgi:hypothetical protein
MIESHIAQMLHDLQDLAAGRKGPTLGSLVFLQGPHELDFIGLIIAFARGGIDETATGRAANGGEGGHVRSSGVEEVRT